jgi:hypothetical protein
MEDEKQIHVFLFQFHGLFTWFFIAAILIFKISLM